jgi:hypothetical protein
MMAGAPQNNSAVPVKNNKIHEYLKIILPESVRPIIS